MNQVVTITSEDAKAHEVEPYGLSALSPLIPVHIFGVSASADNVQQQYVEGMNTMDIVYI